MTSTKDTKACAKTNIIIFPERKSNATSTESVKVELTQLQKRDNTLPKSDLKGRERDESSESDNGRSPEKKPKCCKLKRKTQDEEKNEGASKSTEKTIKILKTSHIERNATTQVVESSSQVTSRSQTSINKIGKIVSKDLWNERRKENWIVWRRKKRKVPMLDIDQCMDENSVPQLLKTIEKLKQHLKEIIESGSSTHNTYRKKDYIHQSKEIQKRIEECYIKLEEIILFERTQRKFRELETRRNQQFQQQYKRPKEHQTQQQQTTLTQQEYLPKLAQKGVSKQLMSLAQQGTSHQQPPLRHQGTYQHQGFLAKQVPSKQETLTDQQVTSYQMVPLEPQGASQQQVLMGSHGTFQQHVVQEIPCSKLQMQEVLQKLIVIAKEGPSQQLISHVQKVASKQMIFLAQQVGSQQQDSLVQQGTSQKLISLMQKVASQKLISLAQQVASQQQGTSQQLISLAQQGTSQQLISLAQQGTSQELISQAQQGISQELISLVQQGTSQQQDSPAQQGTSQQQILPTQREYFQKLVGFARKEYFQNLVLLAHLGAFHQQVPSEQQGTSEPPASLEKHGASQQQVTLAQQGNTERQASLAQPKCFQRLVQLVQQEYLETLVRLAQHFGLTQQVTSLAQERASLQVPLEQQNVQDYQAPSKRRTPIPLHENHQFQYQFTPTIPEQHLVPHRIQVFQTQQTHSRSQPIPPRHQFNQSQVAFIRQQLKQFLQKNQQTLPEQNVALRAPSFPGHLSIQQQIVSVADQKLLPIKQKIINIYTLFYYLIAASDISFTKVYLRDCLNFEYLKYIYIRRTRCLQKDSRELEFLKYDLCYYMKTVPMYRK